LYSEELSYDCPGPFLEKEQQKLNFHALSLEKTDLQSGMCLKQCLLNLTSGNLKVWAAAALGVLLSDGPWRSKLRISMVKGFFL